MSYCVKWTLVKALRLCTGRMAHRGRKGIALPFRDYGTKRGWGVSVTPRPLFTPGKTCYPLYKWLCGPQGRSGQVLKISPPPGFDPRTVQPVASRYTDWVTRHTWCHIAWYYLRNTKCRLVCGLFLPASQPVHPALYPSFLFPVRPPANSSTRPPVLLLVCNLIDWFPKPWIFGSRSGVAETQGFRNLRPYPLLEIM